ncbi:hypothetical protein BJ875DRAFT_507726 [Amylocarpus encephaloides]|uniref:Helicase C-terminal domain-containing protein n=1 Tax=Amylocarpus encephaloides TaxID=45428 RepID=A0A9P8C0V1_9HELO|nr:hypothetical protein BJ875DRAFT_507726 [Amylocarpus encephaloides]
MSALPKMLRVKTSRIKEDLDIVACLFSAKAIPFATIDGSLSLPERRKVLSNFKSNPDVKVLLMTLGTGAAIGRILRLGQEKQVTIIHYIMNGTVEKLQLATVGWEQRGDNEVDEKLKELLVRISHGFGYSCRVIQAYV